MTEEGVRNIMAQLQGISVSDTDSKDADEAEEDERDTGPTSRKHSQSPSIELGTTPVLKKSRIGTWTAARKVSKSSVLAHGAKKELEGTRRPKLVAQGAGNP